MKDYDKDPAFQAFLQKDPGDVSLQDEKEGSEAKALKVKQARAAWSLFFLVFLALAFVLLISSTNKVPAAEAQFKADIIQETKALVEANLRAPATAKYPREADVSKTKDGLWEYSSYVDSQNAFGALLRTSFSAIYDKTTYGTTHLVEFNLGGRSRGSVSDYLRDRK